jgi:hypothetical protein
MAENRPGEGLWGWLGRQVGHVKKAVKADVTKGKGTNAAAVEGVEEAVVYREEKAEEVELPDRPGVVLRRTVIDEVIVDPEKAKEDGAGGSQ